MEKLLEHYATTSKGRRAYVISWSEVAAILGHRHEGDPADDYALIEALRREGAPPEIMTWEGWIDETGWGIHAPAVEAES